MQGMKKHEVICTKIFLTFNVFHTDFLAQPMKNVKSSFAQSLNHIIADLLKVFL